MPESFFDKFDGAYLAPLLEKRLWYSFFCFFKVNFVKVLD